MKMLPVDFFFFKGQDDLEAWSNAEQSDPYGVLLNNRTKLAVHLAHKLWIYLLD